MKNVSGMIIGACLILTCEPAIAHVSLEGKTLVSGTDEMLAAYAANTTLYCESMGGKRVRVGTSVDEFIMVCHTVENPNRIEMYQVRQLLVAHWEIESESRRQSEYAGGIGEDVTLRLKKTS